jgi:hypothetical protein
MIRITVLSSSQPTRKRLLRDEDDYDLTPPCADIPSRGVS